jgi:hypothetical protein
MNNNNMKQLITIEILKLEKNKDKIKKKIERERKTK